MTGGLYGKFYMGPVWGHMDVPRWVPDESLLQNPHLSHMGCPYRTHIITHVGPIWVPYSLLAGKATASYCHYNCLERRPKSKITISATQIRTSNRLSVLQRLNNSSEIHKSRHEKKNYAICKTIALISLYIYIV